MFLAYAIISAFYSLVNMNKAGFLSSDVVLLSLILKRYYEPLRLPIQPDSTSLFAYMNPLVLQTPPIGSPVPRLRGGRLCTINLPLHATLIAQEDLPETLIVRQIVSVFPFRSEGQHPQLVNEAHTDSLSLRPVASPKAPTVGAFAELTTCTLTHCSAVLTG